MKQIITYTQILDSRANPTIQARYEDENTTLVTAVPSGASTGVHEAHELRDKGEAYRGKGVLEAIANANELSEQLDWSAANVQESDTKLLEIDGTKNKTRLGANALLAVSLLQTRVQAHQERKEVYEVVSELASTSPALPLPFANIINGGMHAENTLMLQEFMIVPTTADTFSQATRIVSEVYHELKSLIAQKYSPSQTALGDEGGFAPNVTDAQEVCELLLQAASQAGHEVSIAIDAAASEFYRDGRYEAQQGVFMSAQELTEYYVQLIKEYPIISLEDPFDQDDASAWSHLVARLAEEQLVCQVVGDDLTVSNQERIQLFHEQQACDSLLLKINQIGTITEAVQAATLAMSYDWTVMVSHRSGETEDTTIADLAVGLGCGQIKLGAPARSERVAKYNRLLTLEQLYSLPLRNDFKRKH